MLQVFLRKNINRFFGSGRRFWTRNSTEQPEETSAAMSMETAVLSLRALRSCTDSAVRAVETENTAAVAYSDMMKTKVAVLEKQVEHLTEQLNQKPAQ
jgi:hypothetical protein